jgi:hypothetical protein
MPTPHHSLMCSTVIRFLQTRQKFRVKLVCLCEVDGISRRGWSDLLNLKSLSFRFAVEDETDVEPVFQHLITAHLMFRYKVDARSIHQFDCRVDCGNHVRRRDVPLVACLIATGIRSEMSPACPHHRREFSVVSDAIVCRLSSSLRRCRGSSRGRLLCRRFLGWRTRLRRLC